MTDTSTDAASLLEGAKVMAHLATCVDGRPHVAPVWYAYDDGMVEIVTSGRKLANIRENPQVALSFQRDIDGDTQWMVSALGTATIVDEETEVAAARARINEKYDADPDAYAENVLVRIELASTTSRTY